MASALSQTVQAVNRLSLDEPLPERPKVYSMVVTKTNEQAEAILQSLEELRQKLDRASKQQESIKIRIFSRLSTSGNVKESHKNWKEELANLELSTLDAAFCQLSHSVEKIPFHFTSTKVQTSALGLAIQKMQCLNQQLYFVKDEHDKLSYLLESPAFESALRTYKQTVHTCEQISASKAPFDEKINLLIKHFELTNTVICDQRRSLQSKALARIIHYEVHNLHVQSLECFLHLVTLVEKKQNQAQNHLRLTFLKTQLQDALATCKKLENYKLKERSVQSPAVLHEVLPNQIKLLEEKVKLCSDRYCREELRTELCFSQAPWMKRFIIRLATNDAVLAIIDTLTIQAKGLQGIHEDLQHRLDEFSSARLTPGHDLSSPILEHMLYETQLLTIQKNLATQKTALYNHELSDKVDAALNYCEGLYFYSKEIMRKLEYFARLSRYKYRDVLESEQPLYLLLNKVCASTPKTVVSQIEVIKTLYATASAHRALPEKAGNLEVHERDPVANFRKFIMQAIDPIIARIGRHVLTDTKTEEGLWEKLMRQKLVEDNFQAVKLYLVKEITDWLFFSDTPGNYKLDIALFLLLNTPQYKQPYTTLRVEDPDFGKIIDFYVKVRSKDLLPERIASQMSRVFYLLFTCSQSPLDSIDNIFHYAECGQKIRACTNEICESKELSNQARRAGMDLVGYARSQLDAIYKKHSLPAILPSNTYEDTKQQLLILSEQAKQSDEARESFTKLFLAHLTNALYTTGELQAESNMYLRAYFKTRVAPKFTIPETKLVKYLIPEFVIRLQLTNCPDLYPFEKKVSRDCMYGYITDAHKRDQYLSRHSLASLELILYIVIEEELSKPQLITSESSFSLQSQLQQTRDIKGFASWKEQMKNYREWRFAEPILRQSVGQRIAPLIKQAYETAGFSPVYRQPLEACYKEIVEDFPQQVEGSRAASS